MAIWPFPPNWSEPVDVEIEFRTDVFVSRSGKEQRRALRQTPRRSVAYRTILAGDETRQLRTLLTSQQWDQWTLPDPVRFARILSTGASTLTLASVPAWISAGAQLVLCERATYLAVTVLSVAGSVVTLTAPLTGTWTTEAVVRPALVGHLAGNVSASAQTDAVAELRVNFAVQPATYAEDFGEPGLHFLAGREVARWQPNWVDPVEQTFSWDARTVDFGFGVTSTYQGADFGTVTTRSSFLARSAEEMVELEQFFLRQRGQRGEFMMPSWMNDLPVAADLAAGDNTIRISGTGYPDDSVHQSIAILLADGRRIYRLISGRTEDAGDTIITVDRDWAVDMPAAQITMVCWMPLVRFSVDMMTCEWVTDSVAQTTIATQTLSYEPAEISDVPTLDDAAIWVLEAWGDGMGDAFDSFDALVNVDAPEALT